jgi:putative ABC transport system permease protein
LAGGSLGCLLTLGSLHAVLDRLPASLSIPRLDEVAVDPMVLGFSVAVTLFAGLLFGVAPALHATRSEIGRAPHQTTRSGRGARELRRGLVVAEVAFAFVLVIAAGLMVRSFLRLRAVNPGFRVENVLTVRMLLLPVHKRAFHAEIVDGMLDRIRSLPGVVAAGSIGVLPMLRSNSGTWYYRADRPEPELSQRPGGDVSIITPGYFRALGIPILKGRDFDERDRAGARSVAILNQTAARVLFPGEDPIGKHLRVWWNGSPALEVIGVSADIRHSQLNSLPDPCLFMPNDQQPFPFSSIVVRTVREPTQLARAIREQIRKVDADQGVAETVSMRELVENSIARPRLETLLLSALGSIALLLACIGVFGVVAYAVERRRREIGIRLAIGANRSDVFGMVLADGLRLTATGMFLGILASSVLTRFLRSLLFEVQTSDPATFITAGALIGLASLAACYLPAASSVRVDPVTVLREE